MPPERAPSDPHRHPFSPLTLVATRGDASWSFETQFSEESEFYSSADQKQGRGKLPLSRWPLIRGPIGRRVCMIRPTTSPAGRAAVLLNLRPAGFIGHCNVRSSLNVGGEFRTSKKQRLSLKTSGFRTRTAPLVHVLICRMNPSHHGSDEQMFGAKQQVLHGARATKKSICQ
jgi:hypothetical protein